MDPLSDLLSLLKPRSVVSGGVAVKPNTAIQWPRHEGIKCYAVASGQCWLSVDGVADPVLLNAGDCYLLPPGPPFCLATDLSAKPVNFAQLRVTGGLDSNPASSEGGGCYLVGGHFVLTGGHTELLLGSLPAIVADRPKMLSRNLNARDTRVRQVWFSDSKVRSPLAPRQTRPA